MSVSCNLNVSLKACWRAFQAASGRHTVDIMVLKYAYHLRRLHADDERPLLASDTGLVLIKLILHPKVHWKVVLVHSHPAHLTSGESLRHALYVCISHRSRSLPVQVEQGRGIRSLVRLLGRSMRPSKPNDTFPHRPGSSVGETSEMRR